MATEGRLDWPARGRAADDLAAAGRLDGSRDWRAAIQRHVWSVLVAIGPRVAGQTEQGALTEHDLVLEYLAAQSPEEALRVPVLPRRSRGNDESSRRHVVFCLIPYGTLCGREQERTEYSIRCRDGEAKRSSHLE